MGQKFISLAAYEAMWEQVLEMTPEYDPKVLRRYAPASKEVYGEVNPVLVNDFIKALRLSSTDVLYDLGSGVGNVVLQAAAQTGCVAVGVEIRSELTDIGQALLKNYRTLLQKAKLLQGEVQLVCGDILSPEVDLSKATVVFLNNYCFPQHLEQSVLKKFKAGLESGVRIITLKDFAPRFRPTSTRFVKSYCHLFKFPWLKCRSSPDAVSWTDKSVEYFIYQVDRNNLEKQKAFKAAAKKGLRLSDNLVYTLKDGEVIAVETRSPLVAKGKGNESEENSDAEIGALMQTEFRSKSAKHLLDVLREGHALTQTLKSLGCDTTELEASNQQAREQLREAEANNGTSRSKGSARSKSPHGSSSTTIRSLSSAILSNDVTFEELSNQFASWQTETKPHDSTPQPVALAVLESKLHKWVKEAKLPKKRSSSKTGRIEWRTLTADFAKWKREHDTIKPLSSPPPSTASSDSETEDSPSDDATSDPPSPGGWNMLPASQYSTPVAEYPLPPGWICKVRNEPSGRRRYKFFSPQGHVFVSLKKARTFIEDEAGRGSGTSASDDSSDSSSSASSPVSSPTLPPRRYAKRRLTNLRGSATSEKRTKTEGEEEAQKQQADDDDNEDSEGSQPLDNDDGNSSMETRTNDEEEEGEDEDEDQEPKQYYTPRHANASCPLPDGWTRRKRGRHWKFTGPDGTQYRSLKRALHASGQMFDVSGEWQRQQEQERQQREEAESKGGEDHHSHQRQEATEDKAPVKRRLARRSAPAVLDRKRKQLQEMQREVEAKEAQEERSRDRTHPSPSTFKKHKRDESRLCNNNAAIAEADEGEGGDGGDGGDGEQRDEGQQPRPRTKKSRKQRELDLLRGWDKWREEEQKRKEELQRRIRERRASSSPASSTSSADA